MASMMEIERLALAFAKARAAIGLRASVMDRVIRKIHAQRLPMLRTLIGRQIEAEAALRAAVAASPGLFVQPRSVIAHGIRVGFEKGKGKVEWDDDAKVVARIRKHLPDQADVLIRTKEVPAKKALANLPAETLKKLGVQVEGAGDQIVVRPIDSEVDKLLKRLLDAAEAGEGSGEQTVTPRPETGEAHDVAA